MMEETKVKLPNWKGDQKDYMLWEVKFLTYSHVYKFEVVLYKGATIPKREKCVLDPSVLDLIMLSIEQKSKQS